MDCENDNRFILPTSYFSALYGKNDKDFSNSYGSVDYFCSDDICLCKADKRVSQYKLCGKFFACWLDSGDWCGERTCTFFRRRADQEEKRRNQPNLSVFYEPQASPDTYSPARGYPLANGALIERKYLRIGVENNGDGVAEHCDARPRVPQTVTDGISPHH
jgi:hypothetical protein